MKRPRLIAAVYFALILTLFWLVAAITDPVMWLQSGYPIALFTIIVSSAALWGALLGNYLTKPTRKRSAWRAVGISIAISCLTLITMGIMMALVALGIEVVDVALDFSFGLLFQALWYGTVTGIVNLAVFGIYVVPIGTLGGLALFHWAQRRTSKV